MKYWYKFWCRVLEILLFMTIGAACATLREDRLGFHTNETEG